MDSRTDLSLEKEKAAEAARYALTRRLVPVLRHHMVVHLQPIGMLYEVLDRKLAPTPTAADLGSIREGLGKINQLARSAITSCLDVVGWLAPDPEGMVALGEGVNECLELLRSNFMFRGFSIGNGVGEAQSQVNRCAVREVLTAALIVVTDAATGPAEVVLSFEPSAGTASLRIRTRASSGEGFSTEQAYRALQWADVEALASAHSVQLERQDSAVLLRLRAVT